MSKYEPGIYVVRGRVPGGAMSIMRHRLDYGGEWFGSGADRGMTNLEFEHEFGMSVVAGPWLDEGAAAVALVAAWLETEAEA